MNINVPYIAGVIDSRGHIEVSMRHDKPQPRLSVTCQRMELLSYLARITGTRLSVDERGYKRRPCGDHCEARHEHVRQSPKWRVDSARATIVLWNVKPFIIGMRARVDEALQVGLQAWPAARGNTGAQMAKMGWELPPE